MVSKQKHDLWEISQAQLRGPAWSIGQRHSVTRQTHRSPGPIYIPHKYSTSLSYSFSPKLSTKRITDGPGPLMYDSTTAFRKISTSAPSYSISLPHKKSHNKKGKLSKDSSGASVGSYTPRYTGTSKYRQRPRYSMSPRLDYGTIFDRSSGKDTPAPNHYSIKFGYLYKKDENSTITMAPKLKNKKRSITPGPNSYNVKRGSKPNFSRSSTLGGKWKSQTFFSESPGPIYNTTKPWGRA